MTISVSLDKWKPHVVKVVTGLEARYPACSWGTYPGHDPSESLATDAMIPSWQTPAGKKIGDNLANYLANVDTAKRLGVWYVVWDGRIWSMTRPSAGWLPYFDRNSSDPSRSHKNHVHVSFYAAEPKVEFLPTYVVNEGCWASHQTKPSKWRDTGYAVSTLVKVEGGWGRTESGYLYPMKYLALKETA